MLLLTVVLVSMALEDLRIMNKSLSQNVLYLAILAIVSIIFILLDPLVGHADTVHGMYLPMNNQSYPAKQLSEVKLYQSMPAHAKVIGRITTHEHFSNLKTKTFKQKELSAIRFAIEQAAAHGANGLVIKGFGYAPAHVSNLDFTQLEALAIMTDTRPRQ